MKPRNIVIKYCVVAESRDEGTRTAFGPFKFESSAQAFKAQGDADYEPTDETFEVLELVSPSGYEPPHPDDVTP